MASLSKEELLKKGIKDTAMGVYKKGNKYRVPKKLIKTADSIQKVRDLEPKKQESTDIVGKFRSLFEGIIKKANKAKKNLALTGVKPGEAPSGPPKKDVHGSPMINSRQASHLAKRGVKTKGKTLESLDALGKILFEGLVKKANKAKKGNMEAWKGDSIPPDDKRSFPLGDPAYKNAAKKAGKYGQDTEKAGAKAAYRVHKKAFPNESFDLLRFKSILLESFAKNYILEGRQLGAFKRSEIKKGMNSEPGEDGAGDRYIKVAAAKRSKENAKASTSDARRDYNALADKHGVEPKHPGGKVPRGALRKNILGSVGAAKGPAKEPNRPAEKSHYKQGAVQKPLSKDQINGMGVGGKSGEGASNAKYDKMKDVPSPQPQLDRRKALAKKLAAMRKPA
jgi:hypothetical protein